MIFWPFTSQAKPPREPSVGLLTATDLEEWAIRAFHQGLNAAGYVEGGNLVIISRSAQGRLDRLPALAADLVNNGVSVILATGGPVPALAAKAATARIPIVFAYGGDPVADGLLASFNRPEANVTGATFVSSALTGKRLNVLRDIAPGVVDVAILVNPKGNLAASQIKDANEATQALQQRLHVANASNESELEEAFETMARSKVNGLVVGVDPLYGFVLFKKIVALAARYNIPAIYDSRAFVDSGGLISYGPTLPDTWRQAGIYVGRILNGDKPADLPVMQPTKYETIVNLRTANALSLTLSQTLLATADEMINN